MTESDWLNCTDVDRMLEFLGSRARPRKLRLFLAACCRRVWHLLPDERSRRAIEVAERYADGAATYMELTDAERDAADAAAEARSSARAARVTYYDYLEDEAENSDDPGDPGGVGGYQAYEASLVAEAASSAALAAAHVCASDLGPGTVLAALRPIRSAQEGERAGHSRLLREVFGNPFRPVRLAAYWLHWNDGTVPHLAQVIYDTRAFDRLPILADAKE
jgi:hypothetical protein